MKMTMRMLSAGVLLALMLVLFSLLSPFKVAHSDDARVMIFSAAYTTAFDLADGAGATAAVPAPGSILGDACIASLPVDAVDMTISCTIQAAGAAEVRVQNESGTSSDIAAGSVRVFVFPRGNK